MCTQLLLCFALDIIFLYCVASDEPLDVELPNQWLWDIIDEFIYQVAK